MFELDCSYLSHTYISIANIYKQTRRQYLLFFVGLCPPSCSECSRDMINNLHLLFASTIPHKNIETNDKFYRKVAFLIYTEMVKFRSQSRETASKRNHTEDWALGSHPRDNGHVTH